MVRSARRVSAACAATLPAAVALTGCVSTQQIAARARLVSARELASQSTTQVGQVNPDVTLGRVTLIHARTGTAFVVSLRNDSSSTLTDLLISVGILGAARPPRISEPLSEPGLLREPRRGDRIA